MEESVINILRRSGSWKKYSFSERGSESLRDDAKKSENFSPLKSEEDGYAALGRAFKKEMVEDSLNNEKLYPKVAKKNIADLDEILAIKTKNELLPLLKQLDLLAQERSLYSEKIKDIDSSLNSLVNRIENIKSSFQNKIKKISNHMKLFDNSLSIIDRLKKGDKNDY